MATLKTIKKNAIVLVALVIALGTFTLMSFGEKNKKEPTTLKYRYDLSSPTGIDNPLNWTEVSSEPNPQGCQQNQPLPCLVEFTDEEFEDLNAFLEDYDNATAIMGSGHVTATKPIQ